MDTTPDKPCKDNNNARSTSKLEEPRIVYCVIGTGGLQKNCDVLQIAMKCNETTFNMHINPTQDIDPEASRINGLTNVNGELHYLGVKVPSYPKEVVVNKLLEYLQSLGAPCILVAHNNLKFHQSHLNRIIEEVSLMHEFKTFQNVFAGFVDSLCMFEKKFPERIGKIGQLTLLTLAIDTLNQPIEGPQDAMAKAEILEKLMDHHFQQGELRDNIVCYGWQILNEWMKTNSDYFLE